MNRGQRAGFGPWKGVNILKKIMCFVLILLLLAENMALSEARSGGANARQETVFGECVFRIKGFYYTDRIGYYRAGRFDVESADDYFKSGGEAILAVLRAEIVNRSGAPTDFLDGCAVKLNAGETAIHDGWAAQQNYENLAQFGDAFGEDAGMQNRRWMIDPSDAFAIADGETGHYLFVCELLKSEANGGKPLSMVITLAGKGTVTYQIREKPSGEAGLSTLVTNAPSPVAKETAPPPAEPDALSIPVLQFVPLASMSKGARGDDVMTLQRTLMELGYLAGPADGDYGGKTEAAVLAAQAAAGLPSTGIADSAFLTELFAGRIPNSAGNYTRLRPRVIRMGETSHHTESKGTYPVGNAFDGDLSTCWAEGASGYGIGEGISFTVATCGQASITLNIYSGYHKSSERYYQNGRLMDITLLINGVPFTHTFSDAMLPEAITIDGLADHAFVTIDLIIDSVYEGNKWSDTCISEIEVY